MKKEFSSGYFNADIQRLILFLLVVATQFSCNRQVPESESTSTEEIQYDSALAQKLGADDYGMHQYVMAMLKRGPNRDIDSVKAIELQRAHLDNIKRMAEAGKLVLAGPFLDTGAVRGIYIFDVKTIEEAEQLTQSDPAIQAGSLEMELKPWYGSAALMQVNEVHDRIAKQSP